jgi:Xaa-Pro aminopeptidase
MSKLEQLRAEMAKQGLKIYICFHGDNHNSEYLAPCDERIKFISGFSGSNGLCVVTMDDARMWTDARYYLQAGKQLEQGWTMMKMEANEISWFKWVEDNGKQGDKIGLDYTQYPASMFELRFGPLAKKGFEAVSTENLVDVVWGSARPARPCTAVKQWDTKYAGMSTLEKYDKCVAKLGNDIDCILLTALDQIAWLLNMRGTDIEFNPVFFSYAIFDVKSKSTQLFINEGHF